MAILTALLAAIVQMSFKLALPHGAIEQFARLHRDAAPGQIVLMALAIVEMAGLPFPVLLMP